MPKDKRTERLDVRVSQADLALLRAASETTGLSVSTIVRLGIPLICKALAVAPAFTAAMERINTAQKRRKARP
jgi:hypothetical protein